MPRKPNEKLPTDVSELEGPTKAAILHGNAEKLYGFPVAEAKVTGKPALAA